MSLRAKLALTGEWRGYLLAPAMFALPLVLLAHSIFTYHELGHIKDLYLRNRAATLAARLETLKAADAAEMEEMLAEEEPALAGLRVFRPGDGSTHAALAPIWAGQELFRTEEIVAGGRRIFRAYVPFHLETRLHVARIDLGVNAADFLLVHAKHNLMIAVLSGLALVLLSAYSLRSAGNTARLEQLANLGRISAVLAHEIRNPLGTIKGFAQLAAEKADDRVLPLLEPVLSETERLEKLIHDLLLYGRPRDPDFRVTNWNSIAGALDSCAEESIGARPVRFSCDRADWSFRTDPDLLKQVLVNLVRNSVEALGDTPDGEVRVTAAASGRGIEIAVVDNGPGIPEQVRRNLFRPFTTTKAAGTGLGLSIAKRLSELLGGSLRLASNHPRGTRAELIFADGKPTRS